MEPINTPASNAPNNAGPRRDDDYRKRILLSELNTLNYHLVLSAPFLAKNQKLFSVLRRVEHPLIQFPIIFIYETLSFSLDCYSVIVWNIRLILIPKIGKYLLAILRNIGSETNG